MTSHQAEAVLRARCWHVAWAAVNHHHASQRLDELTEVLTMVAQLEPEVIVEVGCDAGGTLYCWRTLFPSALVVGVTLPDNSPPTGGQGYPLVDWGATVLVADSHDPATAQRVRDQVGDRPVDVLLVDGDHSYDGARLDWQMYSPMVRPGGLVLLHDIATPGLGEVARFWRDVKTNGGFPEDNMREIISKRHRPAGFGVVVQTEKG